MGRSSTDFMIPGRAEEFQSAIHSYLLSEGYVFEQKDGEMVYRKGTGIWTTPSFFRFVANGNYARVEAWIPVFCFFNIVTAGEADLESFYGVAVKGAMKNRKNRIEDILVHNGAQIVGRNQPFNPTLFQPMQPPMYQQPPMQQPVQPPVYQQPPMQQPAQPPVYQQPMPQNAGQKFCSACGTTNPTSSVFCSGCGNRL